MLCPQTGRAPHWLALGCARALLRRGEREKSPLFSGAYDPNAEFSCSGCTSRARFRAAMDCRAECPAYQTMGASNRWVYESLALRSRVPVSYTPLWTVIACAKDGKMRSIDDIHNEIFLRVQECLKEN